jgi:hypothetical protein
MQTFSNSNDKTPPINKFKYFMISFGSSKKFEHFHARISNFQILANHYASG